MIDLSTYTDADLDALRVQVLAEQERRTAIANAGPSVRETIIRFMEASGATKADVEVIAAQVLATIPEGLPSA